MALLLGRLLLLLVHKLLDDGGLRLGRQLAEGVVGVGVDAQLTQHLRREPAGALPVAWRSREAPPIMPGFILICQIIPESLGMMLVLPWFTPCMCSKMKLRQERCSSVKACLLLHPNHAQCRAF